MSLGLVIQLNHLSSACPVPQVAHQGFQVLHSNGIHSVKALFCGCLRQIPHHLQLLRRGWYPSSQHRVQTCATFRLLELLQLLSLTSKSSVYDFYRTLEKITVNTGLDVPKARYPQLMRMLLQWRHLKLVKRGGRVHAPAGVKATAEGELAIRCPSCPWPGINLPAGWRDVPKDKQYVCLLFQRYGAHV